MKSFAFACIAALFSLHPAFAEPTLAGLDCQVYNAYGQSRIHYNVATRDLQLVTNYIIFSSMKIRSLDVLATRELRLNLTETTMGYGYELDVQLAQSAQTPAGAPARLVLHGVKGPIFGGPAIPATPDVPVALGTCKFSLR